MTESRDRIAELSPAKRELLARRLAQKRGDSARAIPRRAELASTPLSFAQERMWFMDQLMPGSALYTMAGVVRMVGPLDEAVLVRSMEQIALRHEVLRTTFREQGGAPIAVVAPALGMEPLRHDLRGLPEAERPAQAQRLMAEEVRRPFDLATGPLIRLTLLRLADEETLGLLTMHHIISDGWSTGVLFREFVAIYQAFAAGQPDPLPPLAIQYPDYAAWQRARLAGPLLEEQLAYWAQQLAGCPPVLDMPTDRPRPAAPSFRGGRVPVALPPALAQALADLSRAEGVTLFMTLLAGYTALLSRYSGQSDLVVGVPVAERSQPEAAGLIGCLLNTLPLRADLGGQPSFRELLRRTQRTALAAYAHQELPFEKLVDELQLERTLSHAPLCQVAFSFEENPAGALQIDRLRMQFEEIDTGTAKLDLGLELNETRALDQPSQIDGWLEYSADLFDHATAERMAGHLVTLLASAAAQPDAPVAELPLLSEEEQRLLLVDWNATEADYPQDVCIHQLFERQAERTPDAVALAYGEATTSYRELNERANQLAHALRGLGVGPEVLVGLCVERSPEAVVGILGILKAGGAYVPLDPAYPPERLAFMIDDASVAAVVTCGEAALGEQGGWARIDLRADVATLAAQPRTNPAPSASASSLAYVIYTSGSTGRPKGVMVEHRELVHHTLGFVESHELSEADRVMLFVSLSFDAAAAVLFPPLVIGATFVIPEIPSAELTGAALTQFCERQQVTVMHLPASVWHQWVDVLAARGEPFRVPLHVILTGGEAPSLEKLRAWAALTKRPMIFLNAYGPTEAVITTTLYKTRCDEATVAALTRIPTGRPVQNKKIYLLDQHMQPVPVGVPGEVYVGGIGLARGYLGQPELTAQKFVRDPFGPEGARLYRTGDLARYLPDGNIEFVGRADQQVKIRGFRIELGEIESALRQHPQVREAAVVVRGQGGDKRLVAYVVPQGYAPAAAELRAALRQVLPAHMLPSAYVALDALPLTPNGKLDERALPAPDASADDGAAPALAPRTPAERALAQIWAEVLGLAQVGVDANFFELGGHSLLATQVMSRVREAFGVDLPLRLLFEGPTVEALAAHLDAPAAPAAPAIAPAERCGPLPLSFAQQRLWFLAQLEPDSPFYNTPAAVRLDGALAVDALERALGEIVRRHEALRTTFQLVDGQPAQVVGQPAAVELRRHDLAALAGEEQERQLRALMAEEARRPFDLARGPLLRTTLLRLADQRHIFLLNMHHIVSDDWSTGALVREIGALYAAFAAGQQPDLPPLPIQYADYAIWQRGWLQGDVLDEQLGYWKRQLGGSLPVLDMPADRVRPPVQTYRGARLPFTLGLPLSAAVADLSRSLGATPFMTLLAAFKTLLYRYTGQADVVVGTPIAGRNHVEIEHLIGFFLNTLALRTDLAQAASFRALVEQVREVTLGAYAHQDLPFERLVEELQPQRDLSRSPIFQVMFVLHNAPAAPLALPGLALAPVELPNETALYDLTLSITEGEQGMTGWWEYNTDLFDAATVERLHGHFARLLGAALADPAARLLDLPLLAEAEREAALAQGRAAPSAYPSGQCTHELVAAQAARTPQAVAVQCGDRALSYRELDERSNQLARHLRGLGVGPEVLVGLCSERSPEMLVALLGILKAGGAYVPLDPAFPPERLAYMLHDSQAPVLLTEHALRDHIPGHAAQVLCLDADWGAVVGHSSAALEPLATPDALAYVLYTSGSTGRPKGVQIPHRALTNFLWSMREEPGIRADDALLAVTTLSFDIAGLELYLPLIVGARVVLATRADAADGAALLGLIERRGVTVMQATPATWRLMLGAGWRGTPGLKILCGGEALPRELADRLLECGESLWNMYGPTETTIWSAVDRVLPGSTISIGHPIANTQLYVLDPQGQPAPLGVPGELLIGGDGLARGYLGRPELTAEKFVRDPFGPEGARLYRTGDLVRYRADGQLEFLSRVDFQIKIRGFRIEIGEIEAVLAKHPGVRQAVVVARDMGRAAGADLALVAYLLPDPAAALEPEELRRFLKEQLPDYMVPAAFVPLDTFPLTPNGKIDRKALPAPESLRLEPSTAYVAPSTGLEQQIAAIWQDVLRIERVGVDDSFFDLGGHSLLMAQVHARLREQLGREVAMLDLFRFPTVGALARFLGQGEQAAPAQPGQARAELRRQLGQARAADVAIVGMTGRFPGAASVEDFWQNLTQGVESIRFYSEEELLAAGVAPELLRDPSYVRANAPIDGADLFDAGVFGMTPKEVEIMDPQQRLLLECAWEVLERAGYDSERYAGRIGVFAGVSLNTYLLKNISSNWDDLLQYAGFHQLFVGNDKDFAATRASYKLNLRGPSVTIQTACSTSLVAVHEASQSLLRGECDMALAGGAMVKVPQAEGYLYQQGGIASPDGHCRAFDAAASGTTRGDGVGLVALRRLEDALADGDQIYAVIKGSAINNDGADKVGYTAPSVSGQAEVIAEALAVAGVHPESIGYVEAHGTGTPMGDPIEIAALTQAYRAQTQRAGFCAVGSVKTNIGHLDTAAGVAGLIKAALAVRHGQIPPSLHYSAPNPSIDFASSPFYVSAALAPWRDGDELRRAGVSSFGIGGTNAHVVIEQAPLLDDSDAARPWQLLELSANTPSALDAQVANLAAHLRANPEANLADVAYTLHTGRRIFAHRRTLVARDAADAAEALAQADPARLQAGLAPQHELPVAFMFSGQGAQYAHMASGLYASEPVFRAALDRCAELLRPALGRDLRELLFPAEPLEGNGLLDQTQYTQPALFAVEYSLAQMWMAWGVRPNALIGHSIGEYVAACVAGVLGLEDALALVAARGRLMATLPAGAMLAVALPEAELLPMLGEGLDLAAVNSPGMAVVSGPAEAVDALAQALAARDIHTRRLHTSHAFHSAMMDPILDAFAEVVRGVALHAPQLPYISNVTGGWITAEQATDPAYWVRHLRGTVRFADGLAALLADPACALLEVGPGQTLASFARQQPQRAALTLGSLRHPNEKTDDRAFALGSLGRLWLAGAKVDAAALYAGERRQRVLLPTYPFERQRYWIEARQGVAAAPKLASDAKLADMADWFATPVWQPSAEADSFDPASLLAQPACWLIFADGLGLAPALAARLRALGQDVVLASPGAAYAKLPGGAYTLRPRAAEDYAALLSDMAASGRVPRAIAHLWSIQPADALPLAARVEQAQDLGFYSLLLLSQALGRQVLAPVSLAAVTRQMQAVAGGRASFPEQATVLGPCLVVPQEYPHIATASVDLGAAELEGAARAELVDALIAELATAPVERQVAYRDGQRMVLRFAPARLEPSAAAPRRLRERGVYLITGGLGGIGLTLGGYLATAARARLALTSRAGFPAREEWGRWLLSHSAQDETSQRIRQLQHLEEQGAEVLVLRADAADPAQMQAAVQATLQRFGSLNGVIHAAGLLRNEPIQSKSIEAAESVLLPKVQGTLALHAALQDVQLDWMLLCSSLTSAIGAIQTADYSAANAFLDAFARSTLAQGRLVISANWDNWQGVGMAAAGPELPAAQREWREEELRKGILPEEGAEVFARLLHRRLGQVLISTRDLAARIARTTAAAAPAPDLPAAPARAAHPRPALATPYAAPRSPQEQQVVAICKAVLGIEDVGIHDNFFELGCDSLIAIQFIAQLKQAFGVQLSPVTLFESPTISALMPHLAPQPADLPAPEAAEPAAPVREGRATSRAEMARRRAAARRGEE
ncbi:amino acid adenylation domain-containing protein [Chloroflexia bacterium SDU3-3]|nr:amino acid adenylation domain-containing protein [Chloroflexia bacterium SDU3-3]